MDLRIQSGDLRSPDFRVQIYVSQNIFMMCILFLDCICLLEVSTHLAQKFQSNTAY